MRAGGHRRGLGQCCTCRHVHTRRALHRARDRHNARWRAGNARYSGVGVQAGRHRSQRCLLPQHCIGCGRCAQLASASACRSSSHLEQLSHATRLCIDARCGPTCYNLYALVILSSLARNTRDALSGQEGRPIHATTYKHATVERFKRDLGWPADYIAAGDSEAERLFNFGVLAPPARTTPLDTFSCFDSRLAGRGSPRVEQAQRPELIGHAKRLFVTQMVRSMLIIAPFISAGADVAVHRWLRQARQLFCNSVAP